jgi:hypothetical protein
VDVWCRLVVDAADEPGQLEILLGDPMSIVNGFSHQTGFPAS